jgi:hypothetical protein
MQSNREGPWKGLGAKTGPFLHVIIKHHQISSDNSGKPFISFFG